MRPTLVPLLACPLLLFGACSREAPSPAPAVAPPPAAEPAPAPLEVAVTAAPETLFTGRLAAFRIDITGGAAGARTATARLAQKRASVIPLDDAGRRLLALAPIDIDGEEPELTLHLELELRDDTPVVVSRVFSIAEAPYESSEISVSRKYLSPSQAQQRRAAKERARVREVLTSFTEKRLWRGGFVRPTDSQETSPFGTKRVLNGKKQSRHLGWDLDGKIGDPIKAAQRGRVALVEELFYSGGTVILDHGLGLFTLYFHMSAMDVKPGELVERGQLIGKVGKSGRVTGPHLHFAVKLDDTYVDPKQVLSLDLSDDPLAPPEAKLATPTAASPEDAAPALSP